MQFLLALLIVGAIGFVVWKLMNTPHAPAGRGDQPRGPRGPDDDPDFLRKL